MYHIKSDKRSQASAEEIIRGLHRILETTPLHSVTISALHQETGISRATFYRLFDTPEDVLIYQLDQMVVQMSMYFEKHQAVTPIQAFEGMVVQGLQYPEMLESLVKNGRIDLLASYMEKYFMLYQAKYSSFPDTIREEEKEYLVTNICMNLVATLVTWVRRGRKETPEQVVQFIKQQWQMIAKMTAEAMLEDS